MDQDDTFRRLKRTPFEDLGKILNELPKYPPIFNVGSTIIETHRHELVKYYERIRCLEANGWTLEEFVFELEKRNITSAIEEFNKDCTFPLELVERAKQFFPNAKFTQAKIELE